jgi:hypothetical protein
LHFWPFLSPLAHFVTTFKTKVGRLKRRRRAGLRAKSPLAHFFSLFSIKKSINIYSNRQKKVGKWAFQILPAKNAKKISVHSCKFRVEKFGNSWIFSHSVLKNMVA